MSIFDGMMPRPADPLIRNAMAVAADGRADKLDLGIGIYRDDEGRTPIFASVKAAEAHLVETQESKSYRSAAGDERFLALLAEHVFGAGRARSLAGVQTAGGTGAVRLGLELAKRLNPGARVWLGTPAWPNYPAVTEAAGLPLESWAYQRAADAGVDMDAALTALEGARRGDVVILQGCCHNPTGADPDIDQWRALARHVADRGLLPFIDVAYQGFGVDPETDAEGFRALLDQVPEALIAVTCSKIFGLYRERTGGLYAKAEGKAASARVAQIMSALARPLWSTPPDHGAAVVAAILDDGALREQWRTTLEAMRRRVVSVRRHLADCDGLGLAHIRSRLGLFALLPLSAPEIAALRREHAIHMPETGRINLAGLGTATIGRFVTALRNVRDGTEKGQ